MSAFVSVLLPVHNAEQTLRQALSSLLRQRFTRFEVIAVDDGSSDATPAILKEFACADSRIKVLSQDRRGLIDSLNTAIGAAQCDILARMDADDISHPDRLGRQVDHLRQNAQIDVVGSLVRIFPYPAVGEGFRVYEAWLNGLRTPEEIAREIYIESPLAHPSVMIHRSAMDAVGGYRDFGWPEDYDLWLRLHAAGKHMAKVPAILLYWREGPNRLTRTDGRYSVENFIRAKAHYLRQGPLAASMTTIVWGAGQMGRRLSKHLQRSGVEVVAFVDIDPKKIGNTRRGAPIISPEELPSVWQDHGRPVVLAAVPSRGARGLIRGHLNRIGMEETRDFYCVA